MNLVEEYIENSPEIYRDKLQCLRETILSIIPDAVETIKYGMPTYVLEENLLHFALCKNHIGFYPTPQPIIHFSKQLEAYKCTKGAIQFPLNKDLPIALIKKIILFRIEVHRNHMAIKDRIL